MREFKTQLVVGYIQVLLRNFIRLKWLIFISSLIVVFGLFFVPGDFRKVGFNLFQFSDYVADIFFIRPITSVNWEISIILVLTFFYWQRSVW